VGVLILNGVAHDAVRACMCIAFHVALCVMRCGVTLHALAMLTGLVLLLRAKRRAAGEQARSQPEHPEQVWS
jgi:hypothetical protein